MTCEICGKKPAVVLLTQIVKNEKTVLHLCEECAKEQGLSVSVEAIAGSVKSLLTGALAAASGEEAGDEAVGVCPSCGLSYAEFKAKGRLGCPACYHAFAKPLERLLKNIHGSTTHTGKVPATQQATAKRRQEIAAMRGALKQAIGREAFEEAACLRDRISAMEQKKQESGVSGQGTGSSS
jgi:protein arginine kinase activator